MFAARAALASKKQGKYWEFHLALLQQRGSANEKSVLRLAEKIGLDVDKLKEDMQSNDVERVLQQNVAVAQSLGINGTPAFIVNNEQSVMGLKTFAEWQELLDKMLKAKAAKCDR